MQSNRVISEFFQRNISRISRLPFLIQERGRETILLFSIKSISFINHNLIEEEA
jgi:hypothetical protein